jgi:hypothetical protein
VWRAQHPLEPTAPSALIESRLFDFDGTLAREVDSVNPALRLSFSVRRHTDLKVFSIQIERRIS